MKHQKEHVPEWVYSVIDDLCKYLTGTGRPLTANALRDALAQGECSFDRVGEASPRSTMKPISDIQRPSSS